MKTPEEFSTKTSRCHCICLVELTSLMSSSVTSDNDMCNLFCSQRLADEAELFQDHRLHMSVYRDGCCQALQFVRNSDVVLAVLPPCVWGNIEKIAVFRGTDGRIT